MEISMLKEINKCSDDIIQNNNKKRGAENFQNAEYNIQQLWEQYKQKMDERKEYLKQNHTAYKKLVRLNLILNEVQIIDKKSNTFELYGRS